MIRNSIFALSEIYPRENKSETKRNDGIVDRLFVNAFLSTSILPDKFPRFPRSYLNPPSRALRKIASSFSSE